MTYQMPEHIVNERQLRVSFKQKSTKMLSFSGIASRVIHTDQIGIEHVEQVRVYGDKTKTVAIYWRDGYKDCQKVLGKFPATAEGYALAAESIDSYFSE